jgi:hypothetical protein
MNITIPGADMVGALPADFLGGAAAAELLAIASSDTRRRSDAGVLHPYRIGTRLCVPRAEVLALLDLGGI